MPGSLYAIMRVTVKIIVVVGARPNFMKVSPLLRAIDDFNANAGNTHHLHITLVHTGQHYDYLMSQIFFQDLKLPEPEIHLNIGSGTHADQTGKIMIAFEKVLAQRKPDLVIVVGDVNSTLASTLAAAKLNIPVAHIEAGLRSFDRIMPEEINRLLTDAISSLLFTPSADADENLVKEGITRDKIFLVGNIMIDSLIHNLNKARDSKILHKLGLSEKGYALLTLHRPSNVDDNAVLQRIIAAVNQISSRIPIIFSAHPRTRNNILKFGYSSLFEKGPVKIIEPLGYLDFLNLEMNARFVMTDSGGIQEETTFFNIPCLTLRDNTERPITITQGTNLLVRRDTQSILKEATKILDGYEKKGGCPPLWDGNTAQRIVEIIGHRACID